MVVSYNWLKELVDFPYSPEELSGILTGQGMTVDGLQKIGAPYNNIVVGELVTVTQHPDADKLSVCTVDTGSEQLQIVCGAPGIKAGQKIFQLTVENYSVLPVADGVPLVFKNYIFDVFTGFAHGVNYLVGFLLFDACIIGSLDDQQRALNLICAKKR